MKKNIMSFGIIFVLIAIVVVSFATDKNGAKQAQSKDANEVIESSETASTEQTSDEVEYYAPDFELKSLNGETVRLSQYAGKKVILNFWATWCTLCKQEMPHLQSFYERYKDQGVEIVAVNVTDQDKGKNAVAKIAEEYGLSFDILLDEEGYAGMEYQIISLPTSFFIDEEGQIMEAIAGPMDEDLIEDLINQI